MRNIKLFIALIVIVFLVIPTIQLHASIKIADSYGEDMGMPGPIDPQLLSNIILETEKELNTIQANFERTDRTLNAQLWKIEKDLQEIKRFQKRKRINLLDQKICVEEAIEANNTQAETNALKVRYRKGIDLIKLLYEKILALDHHFTGMQTYQNIILLSNPHTYPEFQKIQSVIEGRLKKGAAIKLPPILETNPYLSATFSIAGTLLGSGGSSSKQKELDDISCILDFTVRMNSDLSVIQHETEYLKTANQNLKKECEKLFMDYTKVVNYIVPIEKCRENDDWERLYDNLEGLISAINSTSQSGNNSGGGQWNGGYPDQGSNEYDNGSNNSSGYNSGSSGYNSGSSGYYSSGSYNSNSSYGSSNGYGNNDNYNSGGYNSNSSGNSNYGSGYNSGGYNNNSYGNSNGYSNNSSSSYGNSNSSYGSSGNSSYGSNNNNYNSNSSSGYNNGSNYGGSTNNGYDNYNNNSSGGYGSSGNSGQNNSQNGNQLSKRALERARIDLEFSTQRVAEFITSYNNFVTQGTQYYQKFDNIVSTYENEDECQGKLPRQFGELKFDIKSTIEKFNNTYNLPEIQGSRMRDLLYGVAGR